MVNQIAKAHEFGQIDKGSRVHLLVDKKDCISLEIGKSDGVSGVDAAEGDRSWLGMSKALFGDSKK